MALNKNVLAFATSQFAFNMMNSVFTFYYVNIFLNRYEISQNWFNVVQAIYMVWNALNDPLFAYFQDNSDLAIFQSRRYSILYGAPVMAICFLLPWFPWADYQQNSMLVGIHLFASLFLYDALYTLIGLAQCALYTEMSHRHEDRLQLTKYGTIASLLGSTSVFWCELFSNSLNSYGNFQITCIIIAFISWLSLRYTGYNARSEYDTVEKNMADPENVQTADVLTNEKPQSLLKGYWEIICQSNVLILVTVNFCTEFHMTYERNFLKIFADELIPKDHISDLTRKLLYGSVFVLPQIVVLTSSKFVQKYGAYQLYRLAFYIKILSSLVMYTAGPTHTWVMAAFFLVDTALPFATSSYFSILMADCVDYDMRLHRRKSPLSSMFFGMNALFIKPAQSLAPVFVVGILKSNGYGQIRADSDPSVADQLHGTMFQVLCMLPFVLGVVQSLLWTKYTLRDSHLTTQKS
ncbi:transmembrane protein 180-like [Ptychodera flava]|uniref:transmembrane protein 180-like n=1 Tax=Ptychodera flava TaxID=63121 RepID=UPI00396A1CCE